MAARVYEDGTVQAGLRLPSDLADWCTDRAKRSGQTRNGWIAGLISKERERITDEKDERGKEQTA